MSSADFEVISSAPGKVILFGEHAVVHGVTAIAAALSDLRIFVVLNSSATVNGDAGLQVTFEDIKDSNNESVQVSVPFSKIRSAIKEVNKDPNTSVKMSEEAKAELLGEFPGCDPAVSQCLSVMTYLVGNMLPELVWSDEHPHLQNISFTINVKSHGLPLGAGLGSSAAFSVAMVGACYRARQNLVPSSIAPNDNNAVADVVVPEKDQLAVMNGWAFAAEVLLHGSPSGLDNTVSCYGGLVRFTRKVVAEGEFENVVGAPPLDILLTNTKVPRSTKTLVAGVKTLLEALPQVVRPIFDSIEAVSLEFLSAVAKYTQSESKDLTELQAKVGTLFGINHHLLVALGVGHNALTRVVESSSEHGYACKLTGAGGGGCAITLLNGQTGAGTGSSAALSCLQSDLSSQGFEVFQSAIGGNGLQWHRVKPTSV